MAASHAESGRRAHQRLAPERDRGPPFSVLSPATDIAAGKEERKLRSVRKTGRYQEEAPRVRKDGTTFMAHVTVTPLIDGEGGLLSW